METLSNFGRFQTNWDGRWSSLTRTPAQVAFPFFWQRGLDSGCWRATSIHRVELLEANLERWTVKRDDLAPAAVVCEDARAWKNQIDCVAAPMRCWSICLTTVSNTFPTCSGL